MQYSASASFISSCNWGSRYATTSCSPASTGIRLLQSLCTFRLHQENTCVGSNSPMTGLLATLAMGQAPNLVPGALGCLSRLAPLLATGHHSATWGARFSSTQSSGKHSAVYITDVDGGVVKHHPLMLGLMNYFERHLPYVGYFAPIGGTPLVDSKNSTDAQLRLIHGAFEHKNDIRSMFGVPQDEALSMIAAGKTADMLDRIYAAYASYRDVHDVVVIQGTDVGAEDMDSQIAAALGTPAVITAKWQAGNTLADVHTRLLLKRQALLDHKVPVLGAVVNKAPPADLPMLTSQLSKRCADSGLPLLGVLPEDKVLRSLRLDQVQSTLGAELMFGSTILLDQTFDSLMVGSQRLEELLEVLSADGEARPLILTSLDRLDLLLGLLASQISVAGPSVAGVVLTPAGDNRNARSYAKDQAQRIFDGIRNSGLYQGSLLPVMCTDMNLVDVVRALDNMQGTILPSSARKISQCKVLFDTYMDANSLVAGLERVEAYSAAAGVVTPKMFQHDIKTKCLAQPQKIVLPESNDPRVLKAAAEVTRNGLARIVLLGDPAVVGAEAKKLGVDISNCSVVNPQNCEAFDKYLEGLLEARRKKGLARDAAVDMLRNDINMFGVMMVASGDADGMVSGACHTTAATIRPAMQVLRTPHLVSSIFFMCLPDKVLVYGDCAVNVAPSSEDLAQIAMVSADTAKAFGLEARVAMLSYSTLGSGAGPDVQKVVDAVQLAKSSRPDLKLEGPIQYDAAIDPAVAAVKIKTKSEVAGKATVFVFPDLNTGNNTYKAVQQSTGAIAMGPVMQGLAKPVNDLSRGCTVPDIVNTICVTSVQAMQAKAAAGATKQASS